SGSSHNTLRIKRPKKVINPSDRTTCGSLVRWIARDFPKRPAGGLKIGDCGNGAGRRVTEVVKEAMGFGGNFWDKPFSLKIGLYALRHTGNGVRIDIQARIASRSIPLACCVLQLCCGGCSQGRRHL